MLQFINSKKYVIYILLLFFLTTFNNLNLHKLNIFKINKIEIIQDSILAPDLTLKNKLIQDLDYLRDKNIFLIDSDQLELKLLKNEWISKFDIRKNYPSKLIINFEKTKPIASIQVEGKNFLIGSNYKIIKPNSQEYNLPQVFGKPKMSDFQKIIKEIELSKIDFKNVQNFYYFKSNRWNIKLDNNILIKLPSNDVSKSLNLAWKILKDEKILNKNVINLSVKNQVIIN
tara:strand:- start:229 stop:915 length:687 start_codon:yes stop_codon:yes gene_type:complete